MKNGVYTATCETGKPDARFLSIEKAWNKISQLSNTGKLQHIGGLFNWDRHQGKNKIVYRYSTIKWVDYGKDTENCFDIITIEFYKP